MTGVALSPKRQAFVDAYLGPAKRNASEAARIAGYKHPGTQGHRLLQQVEVATELQKAIDQAKNDALMSLQEWLIYLQGIALGQVMDVETSLSGDVIEKPPKMADRLKAIQLVGKWVGFEVDRVQMAAMVKVEPAELPAHVAAAMLRAKKEAEDGDE